MSTADYNLNGVPEVEEIYTSVLEVSKEIVSLLIGSLRIERIEKDTQTKVMFKEDQMGLQECIVKGAIQKNVELATAQINAFLKDYKSGNAECRQVKTVRFVEPQIRHSENTKEKERDGKLANISMRIVLSEGEKPVEVKAVWKEGKLTCPRCDTTFGKYDLRSKLTRHAQNCYKTNSTHEEKDFSSEN